MSEYSYAEPRRYSTRTRARDREPDFIEETTYIQRGPGAPSRELVFRGREDSIEDIPRDFPPPRGSRRRARSVGRRDDYDDDYYDYDERPRRGRISRQTSYGYYSDDDYERPSRHKERRKSKVEETLEDLGLGGVASAGAALYKRARSKSRPRRHSDDRSEKYDRHDKSDRRSRRGRSRSSSSSRSRSRGGSKRWQHAARAAILAGAAEAVRSRKQPGPWTGEKGTRVATAAFSAAGIGGLVDKGNDHSKRHTAEAVVGGLVSNRLVHGSRSRSRGRAGSRSHSSDGSMPARSRSRSIVDRFRSKSRGRDRSPDSSSGRGRTSGIKGIAAGGALAAAGKTIYDRIRSKSRRRRSPSSSSNDSYVPRRSQRYRNRSRDDDRRDDRSFDNRSLDREPEVGTQGNANAGAGASRAVMRGGGGGGGSVASESTTDLETRTKRLRGKELITAGLATAATIHAVHGVWNSVTASEKRHKLVAEGEISPQQARKQRSKALLQDAAAVGVACLGIKGAFSEWKEMKEHRDEVRELEMKRRKRRKMRERTAKELRQQGLMGGPFGYPQMGMMAPGAMMAPQYLQQGPMTYGDGNPYAAGGIPQPPIGSPSSADRY